MVHTERGNHLINFDSTGLSLAWVGTEAARRSLPLPLGAVAYIGSVAAERLHAALTRIDSRGAACGAPHGDFAPSSIVLERDGSVKVRHTMMSVTVTGEQPQSPEQVAGGAATAQSDVFGLGLILYGLLTHRMFGASLTSDTQLPRPQPKIDLPLERPSKRVKLPEELDAVLLRATAVDPAARYADIRELGRALVAVCEKHGIATGKDEVAAMIVSVNTPEAEAERERLRELAAQRVLEAADELEALMAAHRKPIKLVQPPPPEELLEQYAQIEKGVKSRLEISSTFDDRAPLPPAATSKEAVGRFTQLIEVGFERLGIKCETDVLAGKATPAIVFASAEHECFATVFFDNEGALMLAFTTHFETGEIVLTAGYQRFDRRLPNAVMTGHPDQPLDELLKTHAREVEAMKSGGRQPIARWDREAHLAATDDWYADAALWS